MCGLLPDAENAKVNPEGLTAQWMRLTVTWASVISWATVVGHKYMPDAT